MILYRAADNTNCDYLGTTSFAARIEDARAYTDNPGFGGQTIYSVAVEPLPAEVLDLIDGDAPRWLQRVIDNHGAAALSWCLTASEQVRAALVEHGIRWVRFTDDYPEGCETWALVGHGLLEDMADEVEEAMEEAE